MGYKMRIRKQYKQGPNPSEYKLESLLEIQGIYYSRRGYPDYTILDKNGDEINAHLDKKESGYELVIEKK